MDGQLDMFPSGIPQADGVAALRALNEASRHSLSIDATLQERGQRYGDFYEHARITQNIKAAMVCSPNWEVLTPAMQESLEMIAHKIGRILNGDPNYKDSWTDIVGYARLVEKAL